MHTLKIQIYTKEIVFQELPYTHLNNTNISIATNMREAIKQKRQELNDYPNAVVNINTPLMILPQEELANEKKEVLMDITSSSKGKTLFERTLGDTGAVALYGIDNDLNTVLQDNFKSYEILPYPIPDIIENSHKNKKILYVDFHDKTAYLYAFKQGKVAFYNSFLPQSTPDCTYFILAVWQQLGYCQIKDKLSLGGTFTHLEKLNEMLHDYIKHIEQH
ncbi:MAG: DUF3822 family protein [Bacteroidaceae bacterium]|nr:DUF3822 family protein [Bacteroidaceae bacterium]